MRWGNRRRPTDLRYENGKVASYRAIRQYILRRDPVCCICKTEASTEVDHIWPRIYGGDDTRSNLQGVCSPCNKRKGNTVHLSLGRDAEVYRGAQMASERAQAQAEDASNFDAELIGRLMGYGDTDRPDVVVTLLLLRAERLDDLARFIANEARVVREVHDEYVVKVGLCDIQRNGVTV